MKNTTLYLIIDIFVNNLKLLIYVDINRELVLLIVLEDYYYFKDLKIMLVIN